MKRRVQGFSLLELLLALTLGLVLSLGVSQVAISARTTHASQQAAMLPCCCRMMRGLRSAN